MNGVYIANSILKQCFTKGITVRPMKLQKLLYYTVGFFYNETDRYLPDKDFHKWDYGPVIPDVYSKFKKYKYHPIKDLHKEKSDNYYVIVGYIKNFKSILSQVISCYGEYTDHELSDFTHEHSAWIESKLYFPISKKIILKTFREEIKEIGNDIE